MTGTSQSRRRKKQGARVPLFVATDALCIYSSFLVAYWIRCLSGWFPVIIPIQPVHFWFLGGVTLLMLLLFTLHGLYRPETTTSVIDQLIGLFNTVSLGMLILLAAAFLSKIDYFVERRLVLGLAWAFSFISLAAVRVVVLRPYLARLLRRDAFQPRVLVVGAGEGGKSFVREVSESRSSAFSIIGFIDDDRAKVGATIEGKPVYGTTDDLERVTAEHRIDEIFLAATGLRQDAAIELLSKCMRSRLPVKLVSDSFRLMASEATIRRIDGVPTLTVRDSPMRGPALLVKRALDVVVSALLLVIFSPLFLSIALTVKLGSSGPVLFRQRRVGRLGDEFTFYKFRTMRADTDDRLHREYAGNFINGKDAEEKAQNPSSAVFKLTNDPRVTAIGRLLRKTSLDELPQLINILRGEMSLVGPRPPIAYELAHYKEWHRRRLEAKPGLTGLWQVSGRSSVPFNEMVLMDLYYIDNWSLWSDFKILLRTIPVIVSGRGAY